MDDIRVNNDEKQVIVIHNEEADPVEVKDGGSIQFVSDYETLKNKPQINNVELHGNKTFQELGMDRMTNTDIEKLINSFI